MFLHFLGLAIDYQVPTIVIENVRGLLSSPLVHRPHAERGFGFPPLSVQELRGGAIGHILSLLRSHGYQVTMDLYDAADFGVPQHRHRVILVASKIRKFSKFVPSHNSSNWLTFEESTRGLKKHDSAPFRSGHLEYLQMLGPGQNWRNLPPSHQRKALGKAYECTGGRTGFLRRLAWNKPSPTLMTSPTMPATLLAHPELDRPLSVQEYARIQTFPDSWIVEGNLSQQYRQLGNAVPVKFGFEIGRQIALQIGFQHTN